MKLVLAADLHFGSVPDGLAASLRESIEAEQPDLVVIAGDLTLAARRHEFEQAKTWLASLSPPTLVLPGNHDVPYWNILQRFADPFHRYRQAIGAQTMMPIHETDDAVVLGFNTTGSWQPHLKWQEGVARRKDIAAAKAALAVASSSKFKAVAGHHPFFPVPDQPRGLPVRRAALALETFALAGVDLIMSGHTHLSFAAEMTVLDHQIVAVGAPTALSARMRGEQNGYWFIETTQKEISCVLWLRSQMNFSPVAEKTFRRQRI